MTSNKDKKCKVCNYEKHIEVCHIKPVSDFNDNTLITDINDLNNLVALCPNHHWEFDAGIIKI
jgi:predicted restriction endonuclease